MAQDAAVCQDMLRDISAYLDGALSEESAGRLARHLEGCASCRSRYESEKAVVARLRSVRRTPAPAEVRRRIFEDLKEEDRRDEGPAAPD